jgi:hypothetical protein
MEKAKRKRLEAAGWKVGTAEGFLGLPARKKPATKIFEGAVYLNSEDGGRALISDNIIEAGTSASDDSGAFVCIQSWSEDLDPKHHEWLQSLKKKRVRVTVEVLPPLKRRKKRVIIRKAQ